MKKNTNLLNLIREQGITQYKFGELVGVSYVTVSRWVNGATEISMKNARKIHEKFPSYSIEYITGYCNTEELKKLVMDMWHELNYLGVRVENNSSWYFDRMADFDKRMETLGLMEV